MQEKERDTAELGELIAAVYDIAAQYSVNPEVISRLATRVVQGMLSTAKWTTKTSGQAGEGRTP